MRSENRHGRPRATGRRTRRNRSIGFEPLEPRALLSGYGPGGGGGSTGGGGTTGGGGLTGTAPTLPVLQPPTSTNPLSGVTGTGTNLLYPMQPANTPAPAQSPRAFGLKTQLHPTGIVKKAPHFYQFYTGPRLAELDAVKASTERSPNGNFTFTGTNVGKIKTGSVAYVWGIDRNGNLPPGFFTDRPNIKFDAVVVVSLDSSLRATASVIDIANGTTTALPAGSVSMHGKTVKVTVPGSLLPSTGLPPSQFRFNFWPQDGGRTLPTSPASHPNSRRRRWEARSRRSAPGMV